MVARWRAAIDTGRPPHAVLLAGPTGTGKRATAAWMAGSKLSVRGTPATPRYPFELPTHADLRWLTRAEDSNAIRIDQVRDLVADLALTSYEGRGKVAVIEPADAMNANAANSLLKTLEEPHGDTLLLLVANRPGRLPATIVSRCQRLDFPVPAQADALAWLDRFRPGAPWAEALRAAGGAPLAAIEIAERLDTVASLLQDLAAVGSGSASPVAVAEAWSKLEPGFVLEWLARRVESAVRSAVTGAQSDGLPESVLRRMDSRKLFCYLDDINRLRAQPGGSFNVQLALEGLLIDWATGLRGAGRNDGLSGIA